MRSPSWKTYEQVLNLDRDEFEQVCRLYSLLHDVGHLPFSHLFEVAFEDYAAATAPDRKLSSICGEWFGSPDFLKLHEACGSAVSKVILTELDVPEKIKNSVLKLTGRKYLDRGDPLHPIKLLVDSEIDADRIDATARDGLLAGGEYGTHDIERLCSAVFVKPRNKGWNLAYSHKALGSIEALLLDRYRTYRWIHFHHGVVKMKVAVAELISRLLREETITKDSFPVSQPKLMAKRDDIWLVSLLRGLETREIDASTKAAIDFFLYRDKSGVTLLWKNRTDYKTWKEKLLRAADLRNVKKNEHFGRGYETFVTEKLGVTVRLFWIPFQPVGGRSVPLCTEDGQGDLGDVLKSSPLVESLREVWQAEPEFYVILLGPLSDNLARLQSRWVEATVEWIDHQYSRDLPGSKEGKKILAT